MKKRFTLQDINKDVKKDRSQHILKSQEKSKNAQRMQMEDQSKRQELIGCEDLARTWQRKADLSAYVSLISEGRGTSGKYSLLI